MIVSSFFFFELILPHNFFINRGFEWIATNEFFFSFFTSDYFLHKTNLLNFVNLVDLFFLFYLLDIS